MKIKKWKKILALLLIVCMTAIPKVVHAEDTLDATYAYTWTNPEILKDMKADKTLKISAKTGQGLDDLKDELEKILRARSILLERVFPYEKAGLIQIVRAKGQLLEEEYRGDRIYVKAFVPAEIYGKVAY